jgi:xylose isomerase
MNEQLDIKTLGQEPQKNRYDYYAEQVSRFMAQAGLINEEETQDIEQFIRGCA